MAKSRKVTGGELLDERLSELGWKPVDLARKLGVSEGAVSRWFSGKRTPSLEMAFRLENEIGLDASVWRSSSAA